MFIYLSVKCSSRIFQFDIRLAFRKMWHWFFWLYAFSLLLDTPIRNLPWYHSKIPFFKTKKVVVIMDQSELHYARFYLGTKNTFSIQCENHGFFFFFDSKREQVWTSVFFAPFLASMIWSIKALGKQIWDIRLIGLSIHWLWQSPLEINNVLH